MSETVTGDTHCQCVDDESAPCANCQMEARLVSCSQAWTHRTYVVGNDYQCVQCHKEVT